MTLEQLINQLEDLIDSLPEDAKPFKTLFKSRLGAGLTLEDWNGLNTQLKDILATTTKPSQYEDLVIIMKNVSEYFENVKEVLTDDISAIETVNTQQAQSISSLNTRVTVLEISENALDERITDLETDKVDKNNAITGATKTKITYDSKGLVTSGTDLTANDLPDHNHVITNVTGLETALANKAASAHSHSISNITNLQSALDNTVTNVSWKTYDAESGDLSLILTYGNDVTPGTEAERTRTIPLNLNFVPLSITYNANTNKLEITLDNGEENPIEVDLNDLVNLYYGDNAQNPTIELYTHTEGGVTTSRFRINGNWIENNINTKVTANNGEAGETKVSFTVPTEYTVPVSEEKLNTITGKIVKRLNNLGDLADKNEIEEQDLNESLTNTLAAIGTNSSSIQTIRNELDGTTEPEVIGIYSRIQNLEETNHVHGYTIDNVFYENKSLLDTIRKISSNLSQVSFDERIYTIPTIAALYDAFGVPNLDWDGNADTVDGKHADINNTADTIPVRDANKFINVSGVDIAGHPITWNNSDGTLDVELLNNVVLQVGQETLYQVRNQSGSTILNGTAVYCTGVTAGSGRMEISPAIGTLDPVTFLGLATQDINSGVNGFVTHFGYTRNLDTRGNVASSLAVGNETWEVGDKLYVHPTVAGKLTKVEPQAPAVKICVASIIVKHQSTGVLFVRPTSNLDIKKLSDVQIGTLADNDLLSYSNTNGRWENKSFNDLKIPKLDEYGKLNTSVLPGLAITDTFVVQNESEMLALNVEVGDIAVRSDINKTFILKTNPGSILENWIEILTPTDAVKSVSASSEFEITGDLEDVVINVAETHIIPTIQQFENLATKLDVANATPNFVDGGTPDTIYLENDSFDAGGPDSEYA
jgi:hypothetical protein